MFSISKTYAKQIGGIVQNKKAIEPIVDGVVDILNELEL